MKFSGPGKKNFVMRLIAFHVFISLFMLPFFPREVASKVCKVKHNGCSIPGKLPFFYKKTFTPACNKHDVCYYCGMNYSWTRYRCDKAFLCDMKKLCKAKRFFRRWCRKFAKVYYKAVRIFGRKHYTKKSPSWCKKSCVIKHGSPYKTLRG